MLRSIDVSAIIGLDLETAACDGQPVEYALQPWRAQTGRARITNCAVAKPTGATKSVKGHAPILRELLRSLTNKPVATFNGVFDLAWLIAYGLESEIRAINWIDCQILWKLIDNSQDNSDRPEWSLSAACSQWLHDIPWIADYIAMKSAEEVAGSNPEYWERRGKLDALATALLAQRLIKAMPYSQLRLASISMRCLVPVAKSWVLGVKVNTALASNMRGPATAEMRKIEDALGLRTPPTKKKELAEAIDGWIPSKILSSPQQLANLLYTDWGLACERETKKGKQSSDKAALTYLADHDVRVIDILRWRELNTRLTKFIEGIPEAVNYLQSDVTHSAPRLFSTYTGRMTYSTRSGSKGAAAAAKIGVPLHQWPRPKAMRELIAAPEGYALLEVDASGQEARLMAAQSQDEAMLRIFNSPAPYDDMHSFTAAAIGGLDFDEVLRLKKAKDELITGANGLRNSAKFINLSKQYRAGNKKLRVVARVQYGLVHDLQTIARWSRLYHVTYPGVEQYWTDAIRRAQALGYAESLGGRRYAIDRWDDAHKWGSESSAINFPIQASGADMKELAIATIDEQFPELIFMLDLHDGLFFLVPEAIATADLVRDVCSVLNSIDYVSAWDWSPPIPMLWDGGCGKSWGTISK